MDTVTRWIVNYFELLIILVLLVSLCGIAMGVRYIWLGWFRDPLIKLYNRIIRNPITRLMGPLRARLSRRAANTLREKMAKWRKGHLANAFYETIHREIEAGRLSKQQGKQLQSQLAKFFGLDDLARIRTHDDAIKHRLMLNKEYEIGPKNPIPGGKPGEDIVPEYKFEGLGSKFLNKKGAA